MNIIKTAIAAGLVASVFAAPVSAQAATFAFTSLTASWSDVSGNTSQISKSGNGTDDAKVSWGVPATWSGQSAFEFDYANNPTTTVSSGQTSSFLLGTFTHYNRSIYEQYGSVNGATLTLKGNVKLDGVSLGEKTFSYRIGIDETDNNANPCEYGGRNYGNGCADKVTFTSIDSSDSFTVGSINYTYALTGFQVGGSTVSSFLSSEGSTSAAKLYGSIKATPVTVVTPAVPEPATWAMMLAGFGLTGAAMRRRTDSRRLQAI
jgi:outer membrane lipoprotein-sorting protein